MLVYCYRVSDQYGNTDEAATSDLDSTIFFSGLHNGVEYIRFESEARHLADWCDENGFTLVTNSFEWDGSGVDTNRYI